MQFQFKYNYNCIINQDVLILGKIYLFIKRIKISFVANRIQI